MTPLLIAVVAGPLGVLLGHWLSERAEKSRFERTQRATLAAEQRERVTRLVQFARRASGEIRGLAHGTYLQLHHSAEDQWRQSKDAFNEAWRDLEATVAEVDALGPIELVPPAEAVLDVCRRLMGLVMDMQKQRSDDNVRGSQELIVDLDAKIQTMITSARDLSR